MKTLTVVIPSRNEQEFIAKCLDSIINSDFPKELLSVIVCDGMSTDDTPLIVKSYADKYDYINLKENTHRTTPYALNLGIKESNSNYITILGAHAEVHKDYFSRSVSAFDIDENIACTGGVLENRYHNKVSNAIGNALSSAFGVGDAYFRTGNSSGFVDTVAFGTYKKEIFNRIGLFDEDLARNQDDEFNFRLLKNGYKIYLEKNIKAKYYVRASYSKLWKQYWQYGYWKVYVNVKHKMITTLRQIVPLLFVLFIVAGFVLSVFQPILTKYYIGVVSIYLAIGLISSVRKSKSIFLVVLNWFSYFIIHFSYGTGYLAGIFKFAIFRKKPGSKAESLTR